MEKKRKYLLGLSLIVLLTVGLLYWNIHKGAVQKPINNPETAPTVTAVAMPKQEAVSADAVYSLKSKADTVETDKKEINDEVIEKINTLINQYYDISLKPDIKIFTSESKEQQDQRKALLKKEKEIIEKYQNIQNYIKPGLTENTYLVFTVYDIKLISIETPVPGMSVLTVTGNDAGEYLINNEPNDEKLTEYIKTQTESEDIKNIIEDVNKRLSDAVAKDASLKKLVKYINDMK